MTTDPSTQPTGADRPLTPGAAPAADPTHRPQVWGYLGRHTPAGVEAAIAAADVVVAAPRHASVLHVPEDKWDNILPMDTVTTRIKAAEEAGKRVVVLASGDPGWYGISAILRRDGIDFDVVPSPTSLAVAFSALSMSWDDAVVVSAHGHPLAEAMAKVRGAHKAGFLTDSKSTIVEIAQVLASWPEYADRHVALHLCENLGEPEERIRSFSLAEAQRLDHAEIGKLNVVVMVADDRAAEPNAANGAEPAAGDQPVDRAGDQA